MKTKKFLAILCCMALMVSMAGCFPFNLLQNLSQGNGGSDGPTSLLPPEVTEEPSTEDIEDDTEEIDITAPEDEAIAWYDYNDDNGMWLFYDDYAVLYKDAYNYTIAYSYYIFYDDTAIEYIADDLSEYGLTEEEQRESIGELYEGERYCCIVFEEYEVYEDDTFVDYYPDGIIPFLGFQYSQDGIEMYDLLNMDTQEQITFYTYNESASAGSVAEDTIRIGSEETGYTDVPADYIPYQDAYTTDEMIQYSDGTYYNIVTLTYYDDPSYTAEDYATSILQSVQADTDVDTSSVTGAMVEIDDCEAYQIYAYYPSTDQFLVIWLFDNPYNDYVQYIAVEFCSDNMDLFNMIEDTYHVAY